MAACSYFDLALLRKPSLMLAVAAAILIPAEAIAARGGGGHGAGGHSGGGRHSMAGHAGILDMPAAIAMVGTGGMVVMVAAMAATTGMAAVALESRCRSSAVGEFWCNVPTAPTSQTGGSDLFACARAVSLRCFGRHQRVGVTAAGPTAPVGNFRTYRVGIIVQYSANSRR